METALPSLPPLDPVPPFVRRDLLRLTVPPSSRQATIDGVSLYGDWIDASRSRFLVWYPWGALPATNLIVLSGGGSLLSVLRFERAGHVALKDVSGDDAREIVVDVIRSDRGSYSMDGGEPEDLEIYEASGRKIGSVARFGSWPAGHRAGTGGAFVTFNRHVEFPRKGRMTVETKYAYGELPCGSCAQGCPACGSEPPRVGDRDEYEYGSGRFTRVSESRGPADELPCACGITLTVDTRLTGEQVKAEALRFGLTERQIDRLHFGFSGVTARRNPQQSFLSSLVDRKLATVNSDAGVEIFFE